MTTRLQEIVQSNRPTVIICPNWRRAYHLKCEVSQMMQTPQVHAWYLGHIRFCAADRHTVDMVLKRIGAEEHIEIDEDYLWQFQDSVVKAIDLERLVREV